MLIFQAPQPDGTGRGHLRKWAIVWDMVVVAWLSMGAMLHMPSGVPRGDVATYLHRAYIAVSSGNIPWEGYFSSSDLGHPGPILLWILTAGMSIGGNTGAAAAYIIATSTCIAMAGRYIRECTGSWVGGVAVLATTAWLWRSTPYPPDGALQLGLQIGPMYGPNFAAALTLVGMAGAAAALSTKKLGAAVAAAILGGFMFQASIETVPFGLIVSGVGAWVIWGHRRGAWRKLLWGLGIGYFPFLVRMVRDGFDLPIRYIESVISVRSSDRGGGRGETLQTILHGIYGGGGMLQIWLSITVVAVIIIYTGRKTRAVLALLLGAGGLALTAATWFVSYGHQISSMVAYPILLAGIAAGVMYQKLQPTGRQIALVAMVFIIYISASGTQAMWEGRYGRDVYLTTGEYEPVTEALTAAGEAPRVGIIASENQLRLREILGAVRPYEIYMALVGAGYEYCAHNQIYDREVGIGSCQENPPDQWIIIDLEQQEGGNYVATWQANALEGESMPLYARIQPRAELETAGFIYCENLGMSWIHDPKQRGTCPDTIQKAD